MIFRQEDSGKLMIIDIEGSIGVGSGMGALRRSIYTCCCMSIALNAGMYGYVRQPRYMHIFQKRAQLTTIHGLMC